MHATLIKEAQGPFPTFIPFSKPIIIIINVIIIIINVIIIIIIIVN